MLVVLDVIGAMFLIAGCFLLMVSTVGLIRLPDTYTRLHATGKCHTLGALCTVFGCVFIVREAAPVAKLLAVAVFLWIINPAVIHLIARVARATDVPMIAETSHRTMIRRPTPLRKDGGNV